MEDNIQNPNTGLKGVFPGHLAQNNNQTTVQSVPQVPVVEQVLVEQLNSGFENFLDTNTYLKLETKNNEGQISGILEIDLISFREKGQESRYLSISAKGSNSQGEASETDISIENEEDFNKFKKFISNINWND